MSNLKQLGEACRKQASPLRAAGAIAENFFPTVKPLFGRQAADAARQGVKYVYDEPVDTLRAFRRLLPSLLTRFRPAADIVSKPSQMPPNFTGLVINPGGFPMPKGVRNVVGGPAAPGTFDKLREAVSMYRHTRGTPAADFVPAVTGLRQHLNKLLGRTGEVTEPKLREALSSFAKQYIVKPIRGFGSSGVTHFNDKSPSDVAKHFLDRKNWGEYMLQERRDLQPVSRLQHFIDSVVAKLSPYGDKAYFKKPGREFRVHSLQSKVVPGATVGKGGNVFAAAYPLRTPRSQAAESAAQQVLDRMPDKQRNYTYGFDMGIDRAGKPFVIEGNPSGGGGGGVSGLFEHPLIADALHSAAVGRLPLTTHINRAGAIGAGGSTATLGTWLGSQHSQSPGSPG